MYKNGKISSSYIIKDKIEDILQKKKDKLSYMSKEKIEDVLKIRLNI
jgi:hypothetical protein